MAGIYRSTWVALVGLVSADVVSRLAAAGLPALTPEIDGSAGAIQIGPQFVAEQGSPPRILFVPKGWTDIENNRDVVQTYQGGQPIDNTQEPRTIAMQWKRFEVQCWGCNYASQTTPVPDPALDYDAAQILAEVVWQAAQGTCAGVWRSGPGEIDPGGPALVRVGRVFVFDLALHTPIPDVAHAYAAPAPTANSTVEIIVAGQPAAPPGG